MKEVEGLKRKKSNSKIGIDREEVVSSKDIYGETVVGLEVYRSSGEYRLRSGGAQESLFSIPDEVMKFEDQKR